MRARLSSLQPHLAGATLTADAEVAGVCTDSRQLTPGSLFVALRGERFDAHEFLATVAQGPIAAVMAERLPDGISTPALIVPDTRAALGQMAHWWRSQFEIPLIGVTGSNGKTTVKEMIASILAAACGADGHLATRGNFNNDIGVPLTLFRLLPVHRAAVIELGMNHPGEIAQLAAIAQPTVALVNNAQREHQEFMASVEAVAMENGAVITSLAQDGVAVFPADDEFTPLWRDYAARRKTITFGLSSDADVRCSFQPVESGSLMNVDAQGSRYTIRLAAFGTHNVRNALASIACALAAGTAQDAIVKGLEAFRPVTGRLQRKTAVSGAIVIDDTYNANPDSVRAAIDVLAQAPSPRILVLGDMGEVGTEGPQFHREIGAYAKERGIDSLLTLGTLAQHASEAFGAKGRHFNEIEGINGEAAALAGNKATLLVKGSRFMKMERIVGQLLGVAPQESH